MREWSERHIRELIKDEYKRLGGGASGMAEYIADQLDNNLSGTIMSAYAVPGISRNDVVIDSEFHIDEATDKVEIFQIPSLTSAQETQAQSSFGSEWVENYKEYTGTYFFKVHLSGYFQHSYLKPSSGLDSFYYFPNLCSRQPASGTIYDTPLSHNSKHITTPPLYVTLSDILPMEGDPVHGIRNFILTDKNHSNRQLKFVRTAGIPYGPTPNGYYDITWVTGGPYQDYGALGKLYFEYDTFIYAQDFYYIYKSIADLIGL